MRYTHIAKSGRGSLEPEIQMIGMQQADWKLIARRKCSEGSRQTMQLPGSLELE